MSRISRSKTISANEATTHDEGLGERLIELGWLMISALSKSELQAVTSARDRMLNHLQQTFPQFIWRMPLLRKRKALRQSYDEAALLLKEGLNERDAHHWDFTFVITATDLKSYDKPYALAMPSQALAVGVISLARLIPQTLTTDHQSIDIPLLTHRLYALGLHLLGDLNGLAHHTEPHHFMYQPDDVSSLDHMKIYGEKEQSELAEELADVADVRLEEQMPIQATSAFVFYFKALWHLRDEIVSSVIQAKPWEFPLRLSRLTTAALSTLMILMMTAEVWELGMNQPLLFIGLFSFVVLLGTSAFIIKRQKLLLQRNRQRLTEQIVITNTTITLVVILGMATTYGLLLGLVLVLCGVLFPYDLVVNWVGLLNRDEIGLTHYAALAQMIAALGIVIGSLGASFEGQEYFQYIAYVDEEL